MLCVCVVCMLYVWVVCVCVCVCVCACEHVCVCARAHVRACVHSHAHVCVSAMGACVCARARVFAILSTESLRWVHDEGRKKKKKKKRAKKAGKKASIAIKDSQYVSVLHLRHVKGADFKAADSSAPALQRVPPQGLTDQCDKAAGGKASR